MTFQDPQYENVDTDTEDDDDPRQVTLSRDQIRSMERDAKEARALKRENALLKAGIDTTTPLGTLFAQAYEGPLDTEAIRTAWATVSPPVEPTTEETDAKEQAEGDRQFADERAGFSSGQADDGRAPDRDPKKVAIESGATALKEGKGRDEAMAIAFSELAAAAASGDQRVILQ